MIHKLILIITLILSNQFNSHGNQTLMSWSGEDSTFCYIKKIFQKENKTYIEVDYIQFLRGKEAIDAAKKNGEAEYNINNRGDTSYYVFNDFYIINKNKKLRIFELEMKPDI